MSSHQSFAALRHPGFRMFFIGNATAMLADNTEHVISYWVMNNKFHSPALLGFAVIAHWLPYLLLSIYVGGLTSRFDPRRMIQLGMVLFMGVSLGWGVLFATDTLQVWQAMVLLVMHGFAGLLWTAPSQLLVYDIVGPEQLQSGVRSNATARYLGTLIGPSFGSVLMLTLKPATAMFINMLVYLPLMLWLWRAPYGPKFRAKTARAPRAITSFKDVFAAWREVSANPTLLAMTLLAAAAALFVGNAYQAQMPGFAVRLGHGDPGAAYGMLLAADAAGALSAGFLLESLSLLQAKVRTALWLAAIWSTALIGFALLPYYQAALPLLFIAGFVELSFFAMSQTLVQLNAPMESRGRIIGVFFMASAGLRTVSGVSVGLMGSVIGISASLAFSAMALLITIAGLHVLLTRNQQLARG